MIFNNIFFRLKKGCGYHLDLLVLAFVIIISSVFGLPWFIANTIPSINHMQSLTKESTTSIPGEKPQFLGVREQRVTTLAIAILTGASVLMTPLLSLLPMPVLYGVFLFMGVMSLRGNLKVLNFELIQIQLKLNHQNKTKHILLLILRVCDIKIISFDS